MSEYGGNGDGGPVFVDVYGTSRRLGMDVSTRGDNKSHGFEGPHPNGPFWLRALKGELQLWIVFWGGFFFGHGIVLAFSIGILLIGVTFGMTLDPERVNDSFNAAQIIMSVIGSIVFVFALWAVISVWRCAKNAEQLKWAIAARGMMILYVGILTFTAWNILN